MLPCRFRIGPTGSWNISVNHILNTPFHSRMAFLEDTLSLIDLLSLPYRSGRHPCSFWRFLECWKLPLAWVKQHRCTLFLLCWTPFRWDTICTAFPSSRKIEVSNKICNDTRQRMVCLRDRIVYLQQLKAPRSNSCLSSGQGRSRIFPPVRHIFSHQYWILDCCRIVNIS